MINPDLNQDDTEAGETYVSTAPPTSAASQQAKGTVSTGKKKAKGDKTHPWRDNIEAIAISIVTIVLFKYFVLEAYKIPTGSMQPTLMGNAETGIYDRVIVDKISYHVRDPERFEIAVFKYPLDSSKNFIKRIVGMPSERMRIVNGDLFILKDGETEEKILRRSRAIQDAQLRRLETEAEWNPKGGALQSWKIESEDSGDTILASPPPSATFPATGSVVFPRTRSSVRDDYLDGYPLGMKPKVDDTKKNSNVNMVSDLRVAATVEAEAGCAAVTFVLKEGSRRFRFVLPGPAAPEGAVARIEVDGIDPMFTLDATRSASSNSFRLKAGDEVDIEVQNLNDMLAFRIDGEEVATLEIPPAPDQPNSGVKIEVENAAAGSTEIADVKVWRDIYYTFAAGRQKIKEWQIPENCYVVLGDNSQDSSDGRDWTYDQYEVLEGEDKGKIIKGNRRGGNIYRPENNPRIIPNGDSETIFFIDDKGELHVWDRDEVKRLVPDSTTASFVPRDLIRGRAVMVVWPLAPQHDVYRWKWVR